MSPEVVKEIVEGAAQIVGEVLGKKVTRGELNEAFNKVAPKPNWKERINAIVELNELEKAMVREAVIFFTGSIPRFRKIRGAGERVRYKVEANGYYLTIGA